MSDNLAPHQRSREAQFPRIRKKDNGRPLLMGILNITPDSFYSDSRFSEEDALKKAEQMIAKGADWIDVGGESTRPGASKISIEQEIQRVIPVIKKLREENSDILISIDTRNYQVAKLALESGANMINDVSGLSLIHI